MEQPPGLLLFRGAFHRLEIFKFCAVLVSMKIAVLYAPLLGILGRTVKNENPCLAREGKMDVHSFPFGKEIS